MLQSLSPKQKEFWRNATHRWNVKTGATRSGKTYLDYFLIPKRIRACGTDGLILLLGNTKGTLERNVLEPMREIWGDLVGNIGSNNQVRLFGRKVYALGADKITQVSRLQGAGFQYVYGDEVTTWHPDVFQMLKSRLDKPNSCFDGTCNPDNPHHWFKQFLETKGLDIYQQSYTLDDNPYLPPLFVDALKQEYAGTVYYDRYVLGKWALAEGLVYDMFGERHMTDKIPGGGSYYISVDYGTVNPFAAGLFCVNGNVATLIQEYYFAGSETMRKTDEEYYLEIEDLAKGKAIQGIIVDPSAASFIECIKRHGQFQVYKGDNRVLDGIRNTSTMLNCGMLKIHKSCVNTIQEFGQYSWDTNKFEDTVIKQYDHAMDMIRYFVMTVMRRVGGRHWGI